MDTVKPRCKRRILAAVLAATLPPAFGQDISDLDTLKRDNSLDSSIAALSADGSTAAGDSSADISGPSRAAVWSGVRWGDKTDLGTLKRDNSGLSYVFALSADGSLAAGQAVDDSFYSRAVIWSGSGRQIKTESRHAGQR